MGWCLRFSVHGFSIALLAMAAGGSDLASSTVVVFNSADASSEALARYYAAKRNIDAERVVGLRCSQAQAIRRAEYWNEIARPLREIFLQKGWWRLQGDRVIETKIRFVALVRGMPLKILRQEGGVAPRPGQTEPVASRDEASVDSELAVLATQNDAGAGAVENPYYGSFIPIRELMTEPGLLLVCRLDAPSEATVRRMIDDAVAAEEDGLWGWAYVDSRDIHTGGYAQGDKWLKTVVSEMRHEGVPVLWEKSPELLVSGFPVTDAVVYYGWYAESICGPFANEGFRFQPGAIAVHIHSFSASTLRDALVGWCGPLLERGAAATLGNVEEPYLALTAHLDVFQSRLMKGLTLAESAYMSMPALSWMNVVLGDPIYRPYAAWRRPDASRERTSVWTRYRAILLAGRGDVPGAARFLEQAAEETSSSVFLESLAAAQSDAGEGRSAMETIDQALTMETNAAVRVRLMLTKASLRKTEGSEPAADLQRSQNAESASNSQPGVRETTSRTSPTPAPRRK